MQAANRRISDRVSGPGLLVLPSVLILSIVTLIPIIWLVVTSFSGTTTGFDHYIEVLERDGFRKALTRTMGMATVVTLVTLVAGYPYAYAMTIARRRTWTLLMAIVLLPLWMSLMARTFAWVVLLSDNGIINNALQSIGFNKVPLIRTQLGVTLGMTQILMPFMVLPLYNAMRSVDPRLLFAARTLGASRVTTFLTIFAPLTASGVAAGTTIVFVMCLGFYVTPMLLGSPRQAMLAQYIGAQVTKVLNYHTAAAASVSLLAIVCLMLALASKVVKLEVNADTSGISTTPAPLTWPLRAWCFLLAVFLIAPVPVIAVLAFTDKASFQFPPERYSISYFENLFANPVWTDSILNSIEFAIAAALIATALGTAAAFAIARGSGHWRRVAYGALLSPLILPGIVGALATYVFFLAIDIAGESTGIVLAHTALGLPFVVICVSAALRSLDRRLEWAAATLGATKATAFCTVTLPLVFPAVVSGAIFAFVTSLDEVMYTLFLQSPETRTLPVQMYVSVTAEVDPTIAAASTVMIAMSTLLVVLASLMRRG